MAILPTRFGKSVIWELFTLIKMHEDELTSVVIDRWPASKRTKLRPRRFGYFSREVKSWWRHIRENFKRQVSIDFGSAEAMCDNRFKNVLKEKKENKRQTSEDSPRELWLQRIMYFFAFRNARFISAVHWYLSCELFRRCACVRDIRYMLQFQGHLTASLATVLLIFLYLLSFNSAYCCNFQMSYYCRYLRACK